MEETKFLTKTKLIILLSLILLTGLIIGIIMMRKINLTKEYKNYENQLEYAASNYILKEKISLKENEWIEINVKDILKQKLLVNKRAEDCDGYVIAKANGIKDSDDNITYNAYIKCKNIYTTDGYGTKPSTGKKNTEDTQTQKDTEKPVINLFGDETITLTVGDQYKELGAVANDNIDKDISDKIKITGKVDTKKAGTYVITYTATDSSKNKATKTRTVIVKEKEKEKEQDNNTNTNSNVNNNSNTNSNNNNTNNNTNNNSNNNNNTPAPTPYVDRTAPLITFNDNNLYQTICKGNVVNTSSSGPYGYVARDNVDGNITSRVRVSGNTGIINSVGTFNLYYEVSDSAGNVARANKQFSVKDCSTSVPHTSTNIPVTSISVTPNSKTISVGSSFSLYTSVVPSNATDKSLTYTSDNTGVATVNSNGTVIGISRGSATIKVTSNNGKVATCRVVVQ